MVTIDIAGAALAYEVEGSGESAIAFVHGWCSKASHWDAQAAHFAADHRVVRWDRRGMGRSKDGAPADSPRRHADDLAAILDKEGIDSVVVVGHAGGGPAALSFAVHHADRTKGFVLVDARLHAQAAAGVADPFGDLVNGMVKGLAGPDGDAQLEGMYRSYFGPLAPRSVVDDAVANALATARAIAISEVMHVLEDTAGWARSVRCPAMSVSVALDDVAEMKSGFADVWVGHVVGAGHFLQLEVPEQFNAMLQAFLNRL